MSDSTPEWVRRAKVGDKIVATGRVAPYAMNRVTGKRLAALPPLPKGAVYTIVGLNICEWEGDVMLKVEDGIWRSHPHFRPVSKRSTEIGMSILRKIADGQRISEGV
jgi:hypothetical protein